MTKGNIFLPLIFLLFIKTCQSVTYIVSQQFVSNQFSQADLTSWNPAGANLPTVKFSQCSTQRIFGGHNVFTGDNANPNSISKTFSVVKSHFSMRVRAKFYKIDSWPNNTIFFIVDGVTVFLKTYNSLNAGTTNICGNPNPITDAINTNFNDQILSIDFTVAHSSSSFSLRVVSNLVGSTGSWGIRDLLITMQACDSSCATCFNANSCASCGAGLALSGPLCTCTDLALLRQKTEPCSSVSCVSCVGACSGGYYFSNIGNQCQPCNEACSVCSGPQNSPTSCTTCNSNGFVESPAGSRICLSCFLGCQTCSSLASNTCSSCKLGYFLTTLNTCVVKCPNRYYGLQSTKQCILCTATSNCQTCIGNYGPSAYCTSCQATFYLFQYTCPSICPNGLMGYQGVCISSCPQRTYPDATNRLCRNCTSNCLECSNALSCFICQSNALYHNSACVLTCPPLRYPDFANQLCQPCHTDCSSCNGPFSNNCQGCAVVSKFLVLGTCYTSCPSFTYPPLCGLCDGQCLTCNGALPNNCLTCFAPFFFHLNTSTCHTQCARGQVSNNQDLTCLTCVSGQVASFLSCVPCNPTCNQCNGISFLQCTSCTSGTQLQLNTCLLKQTNRLIYSPHLSSHTLLYSVTAILVLHLILNFFIQLGFQHKSNLLYTIELLQILSYNKFLTLELSHAVQRTLNLLYLTNFSALLTPIVQDYHPKLPIKFLISNKTGYYIIDSMGFHFTVIITLVFYFLCKYLSSKNKVFSYLYSKTNPFVIIYVFRLIMLDFILNVFLFFYCFSLNSIKGASSIFLLIADVIGLMFALCWKIDTDSEGSQIALIYNNQIGERAQDSMEYKQNETGNNSLRYKIKRSKIMPSLISYLCKVPISITILLFSGSPSAQSICYIVYFSFNLILTFIVPYKRNIYKFTVWFGNTMLFFNALGAILISNKQADSYYIDGLCFTTLLILNISSFGQLVLNYKFFKTVFMYHFYKFKRGGNKLFNEEQSMSNINASNKVQQKHKKSFQSILNSGEMNFQKINISKLDKSIQKSYNSRNSKILKENQD